MHLLKTEESGRCMLCQPPAAPRKPFLQKNVEISSRVRRKLNFDFFADDENVEEKAMKRLKINLPMPFPLNHQQSRQPQQTNTSNRSTSSQLHQSSPNSVGETALANIGNDSNTNQLIPNASINRINNNNNNNTSGEYDSTELDISIYSTPDATEYIIGGENESLSPVGH